MMRWSASWSDFVEDVENEEAAERKNAPQMGHLGLGQPSNCAAETSAVSERCDDLSILATRRCGHETETGRERCVVE